MEGMEAKGEEMTFPRLNGKQPDRTFYKLAVKQTAAHLAWLPFSTLKV